MTCSIEGCERVHYGRGFCQLHYGRWRVHGDPTKVLRDRSPDPVCSIEGCGRDRFSRGYCAPHWNRWRHHGDPLAGPPLRPATLAERFWAKVDKAGPVPAHRPELGPCWIWTAYCDPQGYGRINIAGSPALAHRVAIELSGGQLDPELDADHLCVNPPCVNPAHHEQVTHAENMRRIAERNAVAS